MSTPPPSFSLPLLGTPIHAWSSTTDRYHPKYEDRNLLLSHFANDMSPFFVGPIGAQVFLNHFLPPSDPASIPLFSMGMFSHFSSLLSKKETTSYDEFVSSDLPTLS
jgi:hypothetical protein